jgi:putative transposase
MSHSPIFASPLQEIVLPPSGSLGSIVGAFKSRTARLINCLRHTPGAPVWQRNYYEHIVRDPDEGQHICAYIQANPIAWQMDEENPSKASPFSV